MVNDQTPREAVPQTSIRIPKKATPWAWMGAIGNIYQDQVKFIHFYA